MNKMNLPPPFDTDLPGVAMTDRRKRKRKDSSSDSEFESDNEEERRKAKKQKLQEMIDQVKDRTRIQISHDIVPIFGPGGSVNLTKGPPVISVVPKKIKGVQLMKWGDEDEEEEGITFVRI
jgi:hypothetical protein